MQYAILKIKEMKSELNKICIIRIGIQLHPLKQFTLFSLWLSVVVLIFEGIVSNRYDR